MPLTPSSRTLSLPTVDFIHSKARGLSNDPKYNYANNLTARFAVDCDDTVSWKKDWDEYRPVEYTHTSVLAKPVWADPEDANEITDFNKGKRISFTTGAYKLESDTGRPLNPVGRTGVCGRGLLGQFGPNHAADPLVTRWSEDRELEFVAIKRRDNGEWAIPGGMVDAGQTISQTLKREFLEEASNLLEKDPDQAKAIESEVAALFSSPTETLYKGYVDDPRNTDNAWMETVCTLFHDETGECTKNLKLEAGDDAGAVKWMKIDLNNEHFKLYASHRDFIQRAWNFVHNGRVTNLNAPFQRFSLKGNASSSTSQKSKSKNRFCEIL